MEALNMFPILIFSFQSQDGYRYFSAFHTPLNTELLDARGAVACKVYRALPPINKIKTIYCKLYYYNPKTSGYVPIGLQGHENVFLKSMLRLAVYQKYFFRRQIGVYLGRVVVPSPKIVTERQRSCYFYLIHNLSFIVRMIRFIQILLRKLH